MAALHFFLIFSLVGVQFVNSNAPTYSLQDLDESPSRLGPKFRLPDSVVPTHYDFEIRPILDEDGFGERFTAPGKVTIHVDCKTTTNSVTLHSSTITIHEDRVKVHLCIQF